MKEQFERTALLLGEEAIEKLSKATVAVFGVGGVGGFVVEALARTGIGKLVIIDNDTVAMSNINRQIIATYDTVGKKKTDVMKERILSINPDCTVEVHDCFYLPETRDQFDFSQYDYVVDAVDTVTAKIDIIIQAKAVGTKVISSMGAGNKLDPTAFEIADIYKTSVCPLAKVMRRELKKRGVDHCKVVYSKEEARKPITLEGKQEENEEATVRKRAVPGSIAFVPSVVGLIISGEVIKELLDI